MLARGSIMRSSSEVTPGVGPNSVTAPSEDGTLLGLGTDDHATATANDQPGHAWDSAGGLSDCVAVRVLTIPLSGS
jgi:hypothetical protein